MLSRAQKKGCFDVLTEEDFDLEAEANVALNHEAASHSTIACEGEAWEIIQSMEDKNADANDTWQALKPEFQPEGIITQI
jgi:hypothetical protein